MSIQSERNYSVLDTSQLINLFNINNISILNSNDFLINNGFPLIFYEHLIELSKIDSFERFSKNLCMLGAVNTFRTLKYNNDLPGSIFMLLEYEIFLYNKYGRIDIEILTKHILTDIVEYKFNVHSSNYRVLYEELQEKSMKESLISVLLSNITNPYFRKRISFLEKNNIRIMPMDNNESLNSVSKFINGRLKNKSEINKLLNSFQSLQSDEKRESKSAMELASEYSGQIINKDQTNEDILFNTLFSTLKQFAISTYNISDIHITELTYDNLILNKIYFRGLRYLANIYVIDKERKVESSDIYDIYFLYCSALFRIFVDKRTFDLGERMKKELKIELNLEKNTMKLINHLR